MLIINRQEKKITSGVTTQNRISFKSNKHVKSVCPSLYGEEGSGISNFFLNSFWSAPTRGKLIMRDSYDYLQYPELGYSLTQTQGYVNMFIPRIFWGFKNTGMTTYGDSKEQLMEVVLGGKSHLHDESYPYFFFKFIISTKNFLEQFCKGVNLVADPTLITGQRFHSVTVHKLLMDPVHIERRNEFLGNLFLRRAKNKDIARVSDKGLSCILNVIESSRY